MIDGPETDSLRPESSEQTEDSLRAEMLKLPRQSDGRAGLHISSRTAPRPVCGPDLRAGGGYLPLDSVSESYVTGFRIERVVPVIRAGAPKIRNSYPLLFAHRQLEPRLTSMKMKRSFHLAYPTVVPADPIELHSQLHAPR
jgi:hypothetical protein